MGLWIFQYHLGDLLSSAAGRGITCPLDGIAEGVSGGQHILHTFGGEDSRLCPRTWPYERAVLAKF